ncbi:Reverse transcriptase RNA-dependent DNA polymerase [Arabidopsis thaliana x Arabidopsis arenosa]|uniref:Reverse transcriptase RNA-dependent DNA polymerase n=1 Tax=Arabidopsis thaliana x Arabidopsis arenosa TaxID=1240361 RepID=A0A8T1XFT0_9BRAS|nr:Reverse transcriptase RNA-dependent DNA polymerase [Arabidopsis thaliana x Arabidopsis arenosa]
MSSSSEILANTDATSLHNINMTNVKQLTATNFLMWKRQVHALLDGYDLAGYLDGSIAAPTATLTTAGTVTPNPAFKLWKRQDKLIYSGLLGAISLSVQSLLSKATTTAQIWTILNDIYANPSRAHIKHIQLESPISHEDQIDYILGGLPEDYKQVIDQLEGRETPPALTEIHEKLINHELKLQTLTIASSSSVPVTANAATYKNYGNNNRNQSRSGSRGNQQWQQQQQQNFSPRNESRGSQGRGYQGKYQICGVYGHSARRCSQLQSFGGGYQSSPMSPWQPRANVVMASPWVLDSRATHHLTSDLANLSMHHPYTGGEEVTIADGSGLQIAQTGSALLPTPTGSLALNDVLYVPNVHKNLISVYRMCNSNKVSVEFFPAHFQVKDLSTGARLLQGRTRNELYEWPNVHIEACTIRGDKFPVSTKSFSGLCTGIGHAVSTQLHSGFTTLIAYSSFPVASVLGSSPLAITSSVIQHNTGSALTSSFVRYKARLVARGFNQQYGLDYSETFSPVIKSTIIWTVLEVAVKRNWSIHQVDINNAFLQGTLTEEVYVSQPPGFVDLDRLNHVCRLQKALYDLKQAPRAWYQELRNFLLKAGFTNSLADTSLFIYHQGSDFLYVLVYVDDIIIAGVESLVKRFNTALAARFSLKDLGALNYFLGIEATRSANGLHLMQRKYINDLLTKTNMLGVKPVSTPMAATPMISLFTGSALDDASEYRSVLGSLQYLSFTRPDIAFAVNRLSQFMHRPTDAHWLAVKRILRYLAGTTTHGIFLRANAPLTIHAFSDADWARDNNDYLSTNAYIVYFGGSPISWSSKKQKSVARSSIEAEYRAVANTASELRWICSLLSEMGIPLPTAPVIYCDNMGATYLCANPVFHSRMKHVALDYHFVRGNIQSGALRVSHVSTKDQLADSLTKLLPRPRFQELNSKIGVKELPPS